MALRRSIQGTGAVSLDAFARGRYVALVRVGNQQLGAIDVVLE